jgi:hypothetical protein
MNQHCYSELCLSFKELASWTWHKLANADRLNMAFNEETITESLFLKLAQRHSGRGLTIRSYTKNEEGTGTAATGGNPTGADWSFWFGDLSGKGIEVRIQAKRLFAKSGKYENLEGSGVQRKNLISNSKGAIPLYVFYNRPCKDLSGFPIYFGSLCKYCELDRFWPFNISIFGCSFSPITAIPPKNKPRPTDIKFMLPWHCLVCERFKKSSSRGSLPSHVAEVLKNSFEQVDFNDKVRSQTAVNFSFELQRPPKWIKLLNESETLENYSNPELNHYLETKSLHGVVSILESKVK